MGLRKEAGEIASPVAVLVTSTALAGAVLLGAWSRLVPDNHPLSLRGIPESAVAAVASACAIWLLCSWRKQRLARDDW